MTRFADVILVKGKKRLRVKGVSEISESSDYLTLRDENGKVLFHTNRPEDWEYLYNENRVNDA